MSRIWKYPLRVESREMVMAPREAFPLKVIVQNEIPCLYMCTQKDDDLGDLVPRIIRVVTTGEQFEQEGCTYIDSFIAKGWFVGHVFEQWGTEADPVSARFRDDFRAVRQALDGEPPV